MSQSDFGTIDPNTKGGSELATDLNNWRTAVHTNHSGTAAPSYVATYGTWVDTDETLGATYKMYDGTDHIDIFRIDTTNNVPLLPTGVRIVEGLSTQTANTNANNLVIDNNGDVGMSFLSSATGSAYIYFGDSADDDVGGITYDHSSDTLALNAATDIDLNIGGTTVATFDSGGLVMSNMIHRVDNTGNLQIAGGDAGATGGHIKLYGGAAAFADRVDINADIIQFEDVGGTAWGRMTGADFLWGQTSTKTPGAGNTTAGAALRDLGSLYLNAGTVAALQLSRNTDGNVLLANVNGTQEGRLECTAASGLAFNNPSDRDLKENVTAAPDTGAIFDAIDIVSYDWIGKDTPRIRWGAIAQDVQPHMPEAVYQGTDAATDPWGIKASEFIYPLVQEVKSLRARAESAETKLADMEARLAALEAK